MPQQANQPLPDGYQLENYRISSVLSCGGFSIVYLAYDDNDHPVAIKEYLPSQLALRKEGDALPSIAEENLATFRYGLKCFFEEGKSLAGLSHPNVVRVLNFFRANETVYMVMRYERGRTLQEHIQARRGAIKESFIRHVFSQLLNGLREVRVDDALLQEAERVGELGLGFAPERLGEDLHRDLRCDLAVQVSPHAVGNRHQQRVAGVRVAGAVLVRLARSPAALLKDRESHRPDAFSQALRRLPRSEPLRCTSGSFSRSSTFWSANTLCGRFR